MVRQIGVPPLASARPTSEADRSSAGGAGRSDRATSVLPWGAGAAGRRQIRPTSRRSAGRLNVTDRKCSPTISRVRWVITPGACSCSTKASRKGRPVDGRTHERDGRDAVAGGRLPARHSLHRPLWATMRLPDQGASEGALRTAVDELPCTRLPQALVRSVRAHRSRRAGRRATVVGRLDRDRRPCRRARQAWASRRGLAAT
jgi:hypothetical protein